MAEYGATTRARGTVGTLGLVFGVFAAACAVPPAFFIFLVPGYWTESLDPLLRASPGLGLLATLVSLFGLRGPARSRAKAGLLLGLITFFILAATAWRYRSLVSGGSG